MFEDDQFDVYLAAHRLGFIQRSGDGEVRPLPVSYRVHEHELWCVLPNWATSYSTSINKRRSRVGLRFRWIWTEGVDMTHTYTLPVDAPREYADYTRLGAIHAKADNRSENR